ncbi:MAG: uncharacterized protein JWR21_4451 [Herminiimonas sp.]|nr:uncharacterized protein [Herminiimonas sp.]MDB5855336.1 uncharacterized protein [Herminiimonas sp.]
MPNQTAVPSGQNPPEMMTPFGIFYPVGYIVAGFPGQGDGQQVQRDLLIGGYDPDDCLLYAAAEVAEMAARNLETHTGFLATLGKSDEAVQKHLDAANEGATFLLIYAPSDIDTARAMNVGRRVPFAFAHCYHRLVIEDLK